MAGTDHLRRPDVTGPAVPRRPLDPGDPERIGEHRLVGVLGEGGQGTVYLAQDASGGHVAIKLLHAREAGDATSRRRFLREAETARGLALFCTARVLDAGSHHGRPYIVTEYIPGPSLATAVAEDGPRTGSGLHRLAVATLTSLAAIHRAGIVHRDFKPGNVILGPEGPVVIDFGIASAAHHTVSGDGMAGTPAFIAPEQLAGQRPGPASDVFSWAVTIAYAATGRLPFAGPTVPAVLMAISAREPDLSGVPADFRPLLEAGLAKDPAARPAASALLRALTGDDAVTPATAPVTTAPADPARTVVSGGAGIPAGADTGNPPSRRRWLVGLAAGVTAVLVVAGVLLLYVSRGGEPGPRGGALLYGDDFSNRDNWDGYTFDPDAAGDERTTRGYEIERGVYTVRADSADPDNVALSPVPAKTDAPAGRDVLVGVTAEPREDPGQGGFGLVCRWDEDASRGYAFLLGIDGTARVLRRSEGNNLDVAPPVKAAPPRAGRAVRLQATCRGSRLTFWIDGTRAFDAEDAHPLPSGPHNQVGVIAHASEAGGGVVTVSFDDFSVSKAG
ncbi:serine/threonine-protein kinase [Microbispora triticiradicis]|uniref:serine/threonine-protein kinase n=1 Tax=Microbispora triticiradicis TaxID=2200763 RepID=UPI001AD7C68E|nr:serine/threonine-protein kinase [Microbispora triticiradicis]MBO4271071.1 protein kinase [Microbispora triticiradicis]